MKKLLLPVLFWATSMLVSAQCSLLPNAVPGILLVHQNTNCFNNSGVAYNPNLNLYYGVRAGNSTFPLETWTAAGAPLFNTTAGFDWRGMWWNPTTNQLEGNGYNTSGIWRANLNGSGHALNTGLTIFPGMNQPNAQSCGDLDWQAYEIIYFNAGLIYRYSRTTNAFLGSYALTGTPVAMGNMNVYTVMYTGCTGMEIALLDYVNKRIYLYNKATGAYAGMSQLPAAAVTTSAFRVSWANGYVWLFNLADFTWYSYRIFGAPLPVELLSFNAIYDHGRVKLDWATASEINNHYFIVERSQDAVHFTDLMRVQGAGNSNEVVQYLEFDDAPFEGTSYYRLSQVDFDGSTQYSQIVAIDVPKQAAIEIYPNPASEYFMIAGDIEENSTLELVNNMGEVVVEQKIEDRRIDISCLAAGLYFLRIHSSSNTVVKRIMVE